MELLTPAACSTPVTRGEVNWLTWPVLKIAKGPNRASAASRAATQNSVSMGFDTRQDRTFLVAQSIVTQSITAAKYRPPAASEYT